MRKQLIIAAKNGDDSAFAELTDSYRPLIESMTVKYGVLTEGFGADKDDVRQEASFAFYKAVMTFDTEQSKVSFGLYAKVCIRNRLISMLRSLKKRPRVAAQPKREVQTKKELSFPRDELEALAKRVLSATEKTVFLMYADGKSYAEIAEFLNISEKSVDNALFRAKRKIRQNVNS